MIKLREGRKEFKVWANDEKLVAAFLEVRQKLQSPQNNMDWWIKNKTPEELRTFLDSYKSKNQIKKEVVANGAEKIYDEGGWLLYKIKTHEAAKIYGKGTKWCIAGNYPGHESRGKEYFKDYLSSRYSQYYILINNNIKPSSIGGYVNNKWCICPYKNAQNAADIWAANDDVLPFVPGAPEGLPEIPDVSDRRLYVIEDGVFKGVTSDLRRGAVLSIPAEAVEIAPKALYGNKKVQGVTIPNTVKKIGRGAFAASAISGNLIIPDSVTEIGSHAFAWCEGLGTVEFGKGVSSLPARALAFCTTLLVVKFKGKITEIADNAMEGYPPGFIKYSNNDNDYLVNWASEHKIKNVMFEA